MKPDFNFDPSEEASLLKELVLQVRKTIGPFAAPKRVILVGDLPKTRSGKVRLPFSCSERRWLLTGVFFCARIRL